MSDIENYNIYHVDVDKNKGFPGNHYFVLTIFAHTKNELSDEK